MGVDLRGKFSSVGVSWVSVGVSAVLRRFPTDLGPGVGRGRGGVSKNPTRLDDPKGSADNKRIIRK